MLIEDLINPGQYLKIKYKDFMKAKEKKLGEKKDGEKKDGEKKDGEEEEKEEVANSTELKYF
jgi:hypothetical protein